MPTNLGGRRLTPTWAYVLVVVAVLCLATGAVFFSLMVEVPVMLKVCWRLQLTTLFLTPGFVKDMRNASPELTARWIRELPLMTLNGAILAIHFYCFAYGLDNTSFAAANVLVSTPPIIFVLAAASAWFLGRQLRPALSARRARRKFTGDPPLPFDEALEFMWTFVAPSAAPNQQQTTPTSPARVHVQQPGDDKSSNVSDAAAAISKGAPIAPVDTTPAPLRLIRIAETGKSDDIRSDADARGGIAAAALAASADPDGAPASIMTTDAATHAAACVSPSPPAGTKIAPGSEASARPLPQPILEVVTEVDDDALPPGPLPPTAFEVAGSLLGFLGVIVLVLLRSDDASAPLASEEDAGGAGAPSLALIRAHSLRGDISELIAAATIALYLAIGRSLRRWMPLWAYVWPVTAVAALTAAVASVWLYDAPVIGLGSDSLLGWASSPRLLTLALATAIVPGVLGHTMANMSLSYVHPLILTTAQLMQPLISGLYGFAAGVQGRPATATLAACPIIMLGIGFTVLGSRSSPLFDGVSRWMSGARGRGSGGSVSSVYAQHVEVDEEEDTGADAAAAAAATAAAQLHGSDRCVRLASLTSHERDDVNDGDDASKQQASPAAVAVSVCSSSSCSIDRCDVRDHDTPCGAAPCCKREPLHQQQQQQQLAGSPHATHSRDCAEGEGTGPTTGTHSSDSDEGVGTGPTTAGSTGRVVPRPQGLARLAWTSRRGGSMLKLF